MGRLPTILIADDEPDLRDILRTVLESAGYSVIEAADGEEALQHVRKQAPDLLILDYMMPRMTGPQVCATLKEDMLLRHLPIIMLTGKSEVKDKIHGINAGADDYVIKPYDPTELLVRVKMVLRRTTQELEANPLTRFPGNTSIQREIETRIAAAQPFAACYIDLDRFKAFNDHYGFTRGDEAIKATARTLLDVTAEFANPATFLGHIGGDDFIVLAPLDISEKLCEAIVKHFDMMSPKLYDEADRQKGHIVHVNRQGEEEKISLLSVSIALVASADHKLEHPAQVAAIGAELKAFAKQFPNSLYVRNRRKPGDASGTRA
jgi:diguanylate cyclase (GGDEF)-like protein